MAVSAHPERLEEVRADQPRYRLPLTVLISAVLWLSPQQRLGAQRLDAVFASSSSMPNLVCLNDGDAAFGEFGSSACGDMGGDTDSSNGIALGFVDDDLNLDAVFANAYSPNRVCFGDGGGGFTCSEVSADVKFSTGVALGHVNRDRNLDAVFSNAGNSPLPAQENRACLGDGSGGFSCSNVSADKNRSSDVALGYVDGDHNLDGVFTNSGSENRVCLGDGGGGFSCADVSNDVGPTLAVALGFVDGDSTLDATFGNSSPSRAKTDPLRSPFDVSYST